MPVALASASAAVLVMGLMATPCVVEPLEIPKVKPGLP